MTTREQSISITTQACTELTEMSQQESIEMPSQEESLGWDKTTSYNKERTQEVLKPPRRPCCKVQYKPRWFFSKGGFLVLLWVVLSTAASLIPDNFLVAFLDKVTDAHIDMGYEHLFYLRLLPVFSIITTVLLSGWIADTLLGNYATIKVGMVLLFFSLTLFSVLTILLPDVIVVDIQNDVNIVLTAVLLAFSSAFSLTGEAVARVNAVQLGLEQMPYASTNNITSFIAWFVLSEYIGFWLADVCTRLLPCMKQLFYYYKIWGLIAVLCASVILCSDFLFAPKWLKKEPKSKQSIKAIYKVLKYAKQHKYPTHRSSLTYWEEELPSRIDFGKSKYGGPFTIEQVENVKTVLRMLAVSLPIWIVFESLFLLQQNQTVIPTTVVNTTDCSRAVVDLFTINAHWWTIVTIIIHEFFIYPFIQKSPTTLKRFGAAAFILVLVCSSCQVLSAVNLKYTIDDPMRWSGIVQAPMIGTVKAFLITSALEFVCAQSPLDTKNLLIGYQVGLIYISFLASSTLDHLLDSLCTDLYCAVIYYTLAAVLSIFGFVLHCILAHWYKRRKRDDDINPQQWVEQAYDRYLQACDRP